MNVGVFNKVNYKERALNSGGSQMYGEWSCVTLGGGAGHGVLGALRGGGREVTLAVLRQLVPPPQQPRIDHPPLNTHQEVEWVMEVIRYGLSLPLTEQDALRDCVTVYCEWLGALLPNNTSSSSLASTVPPIPTPILNEPERYARRIIEHLHNLFVPRPGEGTDTINKQAVLCHRVLRSVQQVCARANLSRDTWYSALSFLLAINDTLLAPPAVKDDVADQLCERVLSVLFEVWIIACHKCFPSPPLWKTLREAAMRWRHRTALTEQWTRVTLCLTAKLLYNMYGPMFPALNINDEDSNLIPSDMSYENISQTWYRFLHTIGNPVDLCRPQIISQTPQFLQFAITQEDACDPSQHPCLLALPNIFLKAMKGIAAQVDAFLGVSQPGWWTELYEGGSGSGQSTAQGSGQGANQGASTPPPHRRLAKSFSVASGHQTNRLPRSSLIGITSSRPVSIAPTTPPNPSPITCNTERPPLAPVRARVNSILHLFGDWLFEAALIGTFSQNTSMQKTDGTPPPSLPDLPLGLQIQNYQPGRAEALGALCRVFTSKQSRETVLAAYYARFYIAVQRGLQDPATVPSVLLNAADIFRLDLDGVYILVPDFIDALEKVLPEKELKLNCGNVDKKELRRASISILLSLLVVPHHLQNLPIKELPGNSDRGLTFGDLSVRVSLLVVGAVQAEWWPPLAVPLLSALYLCVSHAPGNGSSQGLPGAPQTASGRSEGDSTGPGAHSSSSSLHGAHSSIDDFPNADSLLRDIEPSTHGFVGGSLLVRATYLVCHRLISSWKSDLTVSLAALEHLAGLARLHNSRSDSLECKRAIRWICDYISVQCSRPPPAHSRDLHSSVVAAYHCLAAWLSAPLLADPSCLATVMEVVELGISGSKSAGKPGEPVKMKDEKELKPVSMRVRDAAENLLALILEQVGGFPSACGAASLGSLLDERTLARHCTPSHRPPIHRFRYFVADDSTLLALLEEPLANDQDPQPTLTVILRGAFGRHAWTLQLRQLARSRAGGRAGACRGARPVPFWEPPPTAPPVCSPLPQGPPSAADKSFPSLDSVLRSLNDPGANQLFKLLETQAAIEKTAREYPESQSPEECVPPEPVQDFQTARLFLSHFGFLNIGGEKKSGEQRLLVLDSSSEEFRRELTSLDKLGARAAATVHVFYCSRGQRHPQDLLRNTRQRDSVNPAFLEMLRGLGWPVKVKDHAGWTGHIDTSYSPTENETDAQDNIDSHKTSSLSGIDPDNHGGALYNGDTHILYWADASSEIAFIVPTDKDETDTEIGESHNKSDPDGNCVSNCSMGSGNSSSSWDVSNNPGGSHWYERSTSESNGQNSSNAVVSNRTSMIDKPRTLSLDFEKHSPNSSFCSAGSGRRNRQHSTKILIIWLESYEDHLDLSIDGLLRYTETGIAWRRSEVCVLWAQLLGCGLVRVRAQGGSGSTSSGGCPAGPLADGAVLELRRLPSALRHTALNIARRARLHDDSYQLPHVRRRHKIQEIAQKFKKDLTEPELLASLFADPVQIL